MLALLEVRVGETQEDLGELGVVEVVWEEFHGVCAQGGDVLVGAWRRGGAAACGCVWIMILRFGACVLRS